MNAFLVCAHAEPGSFLGVLFQSARSLIEEMHATVRLAEEPDGATARHGIGRADGWG